MNALEKMKLELWRKFGSEELPSEWDGNVYGGGKLSQRYWEYLITLEYLNLDENSILLDIGGGSPKTGYGFFSAIVSKFVKKIYILDSNVNTEKNDIPNIEYVAEDGSYESLKRLLSSTDISHIACISVFEHIEDEIRNEMLAAINEFFKGENFTTTFEYHPMQVHFESQLTVKTISTLFSHFSNFYPSEFSASPVLCENAFAKKKRVSLSAEGGFKKTYIPRWYPVAVKFLNAAGH